MAGLLSFAYDTCVLKNSWDPLLYCWVLLWHASCCLAVHNYTMPKLFAKWPILDLFLETRFSRLCGPPDTTILAGEEHVISGRLSAVHQC